MSTLILDTPRASTLATGWIISKREDLFWFVGSSVIGLAVFVALLNGLPVLSTFLLWMILIDGPHVFATASRTYFDKAARARLSWRLWLVIPLCFVGPAMWMAGAGKLFGLALITWAQWHIAKQHFGLLMLYKRKAGERGDFVLDRRFLLTALMVPWILCLMSIMGLRVPGAAWIVLAVAFALFYATRLVQRTTRGETVSAPKLLLLAIVIPLQWAAYFYASTDPVTGIMIAAIATNIGHSLQYHRLLWFHNQNRYAQENRETIGLASIINSRVTLYLAAAFLLNLVFAVFPNYVLEGNLILLAAVSGMNMAHYYIDSKIWRTRDDKKLAAALRL